jgi:hypothetical protein
LFPHIYWREQEGEICALKKRDLVGGRLFIQRAYDNAGHLKETKSINIQCKMLPPDLNARLAALCRDRLPEAFLFSGKRGDDIRPVRPNCPQSVPGRKEAIVGSEK